MLNVLLIEAYYGGSHRVWADAYRRFSSHQVELLTLPAQFWKWRMQGGAVTLARLYAARQLQPDLILASDMMDLALFRALTHTQAVPCALYFHENQLTYPQNRRQGHGWQYGFINYASALAADAVFFNSQFHRTVFLDELPRMLKHFGDFNELESVAVVRDKSSVLPLGLDLCRYDAYQPQDPLPGNPPLILWNHRWEDDKNPAHFLETLYRLMDEEATFQVALVGENFRQEPAEFEQARLRLGSRVLRYGYIEDFADYARLLWQADYVISSAYQDFFGSAVVEAIYCGCIPLLPYRLNYPALVPEIAHETCLYRADDLYSLLKKHLQGQIPVDTYSLRDHIARYDWQRMAPEYDAVLTLVAQAPGHRSDPGM